VLEITFGAGRRQNKLRRTASVITRRWVVRYTIVRLQHVSQRGRRIGAGWRSLVHMQSNVATLFNEFIAGLHLALHYCRHPSYW